MKEIKLNFSTIFLTIGLISFCGMLNAANAQSQSNDDEHTLFLSYMNDYLPSSASELLYHCFSCPNDTSEYPDYCTLIPVANVFESTCCLLFCQHPDMSDSLGCQPFCSNYLNQGPLEQFCSPISCVHSYETWEDSRWATWIIRVQEGREWFGQWVRILSANRSA